MELAFRPPDDTFPLSQQNIWRIIVSSIISRITYMHTRGVIKESIEAHT